MNYFLEITSTPDYPVKFGKNNPNVDNDIDLGNFVDPARLQGMLHYVDAKNGNVPFDTLVKYDAMSSVSGGIVVSGRMKELIEKNFPHQVQLLESNIEYKGNTATGFYALNVYTKIACYDLEKSVYEVSAVDHSYDFEKIVLINSPLEEYGIEYHIVRSIHDNKIVISDAFKKVMEKNNINSLGYESEFVMEW